ncbi:hypothetical protein CDO43_31750, partial [Pseudomonas aeruginosa]
MLQSPSGVLRIFLLPQQALHRIGESGQGLVQRTRRSSTSVLSSAHLQLADQASGSVQILTFLS